jgi:kynurenine formamidase
VRLVDLSREITHRMPVHPAHPGVAIGCWNDHNEIRRAGNTTFTSKSLHLSLGDHAGTHVDAPCHFDADPAASSIDQMPLENFYTEAVCLDLSHVPLKHEITVAELEAAERVAGATIQPGDTVLIYMAHHARTWGTDAYLHDFPGLSVEAARWLGGKGIVSFGVEAVSPGTEGESNYRVHLVCKEMSFTHMEGLVNLEHLVGAGRFRFCGFPLKLKGGTASPIRAVAILDEV